MIAGTTLAKGAISCKFVTCVGEIRESNTVFICGGHIWAMGSYEMPLCMTAIILDCQRKAEFLQETHSTQGDHDSNP